MYIDRNQTLKVLATLNKGMHKWFSILSLDNLSLIKMKSCLLEFYIRFEPNSVYISSKYNMQNMKPSLLLHLDLLHVTCNKDGNQPRNPREPWRG